MSLIFYQKENCKLRNHEISLSLTRYRVFDVFFYTYFWTEYTRHFVSNRKDAIYAFLRIFMLFYSKRISG